MKPLLEKEIQRAILDYLRIKKVVCFKFSNQNFTRNKKKEVIPYPGGYAGVSDIIGCLPDGRFLAVEVKRKGNMPTEAQAEFLKSVIKQGGVAIIARSINDIIKAGI